MGEHRPLTSAQLRTVLTTVSRYGHTRRTRELPAGSIVELRGAEGEGKSTAALRFLARAQQTGGLAALVDCDGTFDAEYADALGVNSADLAVSQPDTGDQALDIVGTLVRSGAFSVIALDCVNSLLPAPPSPPADEDRVRLVARGLAHLAPLVANSLSTLLVCHRLHQSATGAEFADAAGRPLRFYCELQLDVSEVLTNGWSLPTGPPPMP